MEAYHGLYLIFELVLPSRNIMQLYIWWQYLRLRYMIDTTGRHYVRMLCCMLIFFNTYHGTTTTITITTILLLLLSLPLSD